MAKLDRLGWAAGLTFTSHGARIGIRATDAALLERLPPHLPPKWRATPSPIVDRLYSLVGGGTLANVRRFHVLYGGAARLARTLDLQELLTTLELDLHFEVALAARRRLFVHAGVVGWQGGAIVIPGPSRCGKSTLVAALVDAGATYFSDEYAVFDARGRVHPYCKPLSLRTTGGDTRPRTIPPQALGTVGTTPLPVRLIVDAEYRPGSRWRPRSRTAAQGMLALLANTVVARSHPDVALATLHRVVAGATVLRGRRGEAPDMIDHLLQYAGAMTASTDAGAISRGESHATNGAQRSTAGLRGGPGAGRLRSRSAPSAPPQSDRRAGVASV